MASVDGLQRLSIGALAFRLGMSKSGLFAHFGSKESLQLATIQAAAATFDREVTAPAATAPDGVARVVALAEAYLSYLERRVFTGGCFFVAAAADHGGLSEPIRLAVSEVVDRFFNGLESAARAARDSHELPATADVGQIAFEVAALLWAANARHQMTGRPEAIARARSGVESILLRVSA